MSLFDQKVDRLGNDQMDSPMRSLYTIPLEPYRRDSLALCMTLRGFTLYVDRMTADETLALYFGNGFIDGKRIYSESQYPVYEGGLTKYVLKSVSGSYQPLYGVITNTTTGNTSSIFASRSGLDGELNEPGEYVVTLNNNPTYKTNSPSGDNKTITFRFSIIANGDAPGPTVNRKSLNDSLRSSISGVYPKYYGLIYSSAAAGNITLAFSTREAAFRYAYN